MYPFYAINTFRFYPYFNRRPRMHFINGIPVLKTTGVTASTTQVRYDVNHCEYNSLPKEGLFFLDVKQTNPTGSNALPVTLSEDGNESIPTSMLRNALANNVQAGDLKQNIRYLIYYNKCNKVYQLVNAYPATITA